MRHDQGRSSGGQFGTVDSDHRLHDEERLENVISCKITSSELRGIAIMFDQHRKSFGWQTQSDMLRDLFRDGFKTRAKMLSHPSPAMAQLLLETEQMELAKESMAVHLHHEKAIEVTSQQIDMLKRIRDYGRIRGVLKDFYDRTKQTKDPIIKERRRNEAERLGWDKLYTDLCKGVSLVDFDGD